VTDSHPTEYEQGFADGCNEGYQDGVRDGIRAYQEAVAATTVAKLGTIVGSFRGLIEIPPPSEGATVKRCAHCGRTMDHAEASIYYTGPDLVQRRVGLCHPADGSLPDCYRLVTVYHEEVGTRKGATDV
jgi:hypothetical protein